MTHETKPELPTVEQIRLLLAGKQYFDNDYSPMAWNPKPINLEGVEDETA